MTGKKARKSEPHQEPRQRTAKVSAKPAVTGKKRRNAKEARKPTHLARAVSLELRLRKTVAELGLTEARKIFASVEAAFGQVHAPESE